MYEDHSHQMFSQRLHGTLHRMVKEEAKALSLHGYEDRKSKKHTSFTYSV